MTYKGRLPLAGRKDPETPAEIRQEIEYLTREVKANASLADAFNARIASLKKRLDKLEKKA
jgi:hypothetical protein